MTDTDCTKTSSLTPPPLPIGQHPLQPAGRFALVPLALNQPFYIMPDTDQVHRPYFPYPLQLAVLATDGESATIGCCAHPRLQFQVQHERPSTEWIDTMQRRLKKEL